MMTYDPNKHHRRSIRLPNHDYTQPGAYFVTICTHNRLPILGNLATDMATLSSIGQLVEQYWLALPQYFVRVTLDAMVIMPDHLHGIIVIGEVPDTHTSPKALSANGTRPDSLAAMIQNFKSISTRRVNQLRNMAGSSLWQRNYYERIIRDEAGLIAVRRYIVANPVCAFARMKKSEQ